MKLHYFPLSSYSQKTLMAFHEKGVAFTPHIVALNDPAAMAEYLKLNHLGQVPTLVLDDGHVIPESSIIIEYLEDHHGASGTRLIPADKDQARQTRFHDRQFDLYFNNRMQTIFFDSRKPEAERNPRGVAAARKVLDTMFPLYDEHFAKRTWVMGDTFTMADCAAAPVLNYLRMLHPFEQYKHLTAYAGRVTERPSFGKVMAEAAPYMAAMAAK
jgi:glutathione S-transferase